jgi:hypothetical protein
MKRFTEGQRQLLKNMNASDRARAIRSYVRRGYSPVSPVADEGERPHGNVITLAAWRRRRNGRPSTGEAS